MIRKLSILATAACAALTFGGAISARAEGPPPTDAPAITAPDAVPAPVDHPDTLPAFTRPSDRGVIVPAPNVGAVETTVAVARVRQAAPQAAPPTALPVTGAPSALASGRVILSTA